VRWDAALLYDLSNVAQAGAHVVMAAVLGRHSWQRRDSRLTRLLVWPLFAFFLTGIYVHAMNAADSCGESSWRLAWSHAGRAALVCLGVVPFCWLGVRGMALLPTKEQYDRAMREAADARAKADTLNAMLNARNQGLRREGDRLRDVLHEMGVRADRLERRIAHREWSGETAADVEALAADVRRLKADSLRARELLHDIRGT
jgi:hypothetical protein